MQKDKMLELCAEPGGYLVHTPCHIFSCTMPSTLELHKSF